MARVPPGTPSGTTVSPSMLNNKQKSGIDTVFPVFIYVDTIIENVSNSLQSSPETRISKEVIKKQPGLGPCRLRLRNGQIWNALTDASTNSRRQTTSPRSFQVQRLNSRSISAHDTPLVFTIQGTAQERGLFSLPHSTIRIQWI